MLDYLLAIIPICIIIFVELNEYNPPALFGIYSRGNGFYWLKYYLMKNFIFLRKILSKRIGKSADFPEKAYRLPNSDKAVDEIFFNGFNEDGDHLLLALGRRPKHLVDGFLYIKIGKANYGILETPKLPNTDLYQDEDLEEHSAEGLKAIPLEPMKRWRISYKGTMKEAENRGVQHDVKVNGIWSSTQPHFDFDLDIDSSCLAKAMAKETWSEEYFKNLERNHHSHYEQYGNLKVEIDIDNQHFELDLDTVRAHSMSPNREWRFLKRYAEHWFSCENGNRYNVAIISTPMSFAEVVVGYVYDSRNQKIFPVSDCDLKLYQHGHLGFPPKEYAFTFTAGGEKYTLHITVNDQCHFYCSKDWEVKIYECFGKFTVNGKQAWGCAEWLYRNVDGKSAE